MIYLIYTIFFFFSVIYSRYEQGKPIIFALKFVSKIVLFVVSLFLFINFISSKIQKEQINPIVDAGAETR